MARTSDRTTTIDPQASTLPSPAEARRDVEPIPRNSLHDQVTARVRDMIVDGRLEAGVPIPELELARQLGISRTPLREALKVLA